MRNATLAALALAVVAYFAGLDGLHIPKNGDEYVYVHIARVTAGTGQWLPLASELDGMRNTKPPLLFWQGIASTGWGEHWSYARLRYPNVLYTLLTALLAGVMAARLGGGRTTGLIAAAAYLAFFTTYRYGRPYLTNAPEVFWLFLAASVVIVGGEATRRSRLLVPLAYGAIVGIAMLYKSFVLLLPAGIAMTWWYLRGRGYRWRAFLLFDTYRLALIALVALGTFALWFALDPDPASVWQEFVIQENFGKVARGNYFVDLFVGRSSLPTLGFGFVLNAGLLAFPFVALLVGTWRRRRELSEAERTIWIWVVAVLFAFCLPSKRSARYLLPAMPAIAVLLSLRWAHMPRYVFSMSAIGAGLTMLALGVLAAGISLSGRFDFSYGIVHALVVLAGLLVVGAAMARRQWTGVLVLPAIFVLYLSITTFLHPFESAPGRYDASTVDAMRGRRVAAPGNFRAKWERYRFLLPGAEIAGYWVPAPPGPEPFVIESERTVEGREVAARWDLRTRHSGRQIRELVLEGRWEHVVRREFLVERE
ncbi:MAG: phospholipid carrier-dependent glycosyltransferase [Planctomycetota bacterium]